MEFQFTDGRIYNLDEHQELMALRGDAFAFAGLLRLAALDQRGRPRLGLVADPLDRGDELGGRHRR